ncbi:MAG TPA: ABC transporter permease [Acidobacteriaceae bacterium]|nr:ABC transporter permease [Acidobacteriaceae bacterium]
MAAIDTLVRPDRIASSSARAVLMLLRGRALIVLLALVVLFAMSAPAFLTPNNLMILSKHVAISAILAIGTTFVILTGGIDLSLGSVAGLSGMIAGLVLTTHPGKETFALVAAFAAALVVGLVNGWLSARAGVAPFIATLGTLYMARGAALLISGGRTYPNLAAHAPAFATLGQGMPLHIPLPVWLMFILFAIAAFIATRTPFGRHVYAIGGNERAATLAGIEVPRVKEITYLISAACAALVGLIIASQLEAAHPATGESFELNAIAAVVLGGTSLSGGRGSISGSLLGAFVIGVLADGLVMLGVSEFWQIAIKGAVIVGAVVLDQFQSRLQTRLMPYLLRSDPEAGV